MKMKNLFLILILAAVTVSGFTQEPGETNAQESGGTNKMAAGLDVFPLFKGLIYIDTDEDNGFFALSPSFEYLIVPHFSVGGVLDLWFGQASNIDIFYFGLTAHGRWYPISQGLDKLFLDAGLGINALSRDGENPEAKYGGFFGLTLSLKAGYKLMFGEHFFVEPSIAYVYSKSGSGVPTPLGWQPGLIIGGAF